MWGKAMEFQIKVVPLHPIFEISAMRRSEIITIINADCLVIPNNSLTHSRSRAIEKARAPA